MRSDDSVYALWIYVFFFPLAIADRLAGNRLRPKPDEKQPQYGKFILWSCGLLAVFFLANLLRILVTP